MSTSDDKIICFRCGQTLNKTAPFYNVEIKITSGWNGYIGEAPDPEMIRNILKQTEKITSIEAVEQVFKDLKIVLCQKCKNRLLLTIVGDPKDSIS